MTKQWVADGKLKVVAIAQEQHAERTRLYKQWKQLEWQILQDVFCEQGIKAVPMAIAIDENGVVAAHRVNEKWLTEWIEADAAPELASDSRDLARHASLVSFNPNRASSADEFADLVAGADEHIKYSDSKLAVDTAISDYQAALKIRKSAPVQFRLGVAYRKRFDLFGDEADFKLAEQHWSNALELDANQYIFRRRIEQYGPRLMKPYPFYDWVDQAISDIKARGEIPVELSVGLSGAEIAGRTKDFGGVTGEVAAPDSDGKINRDTDLITVSSIVVPGKIIPGKSARVHISFKPNEIAKWNNETTVPQVWIETVAGIEVTHRLIELVQPPEESSAETRSTELEIKLADDYSGSGKVPCYVLFNVCKDSDGVCLYLRKDFEIEFEVGSK